MRHLIVLLPFRTSGAALHPFPRPTDVDLTCRTSTGCRRWIKCRADSQAPARPIIRGRRIRSARGTADHPAIRHLIVLLPFRTRRTALHPFLRPTDVDLACWTSTGPRGRVERRALANASARTLVGGRRIRSARGTADHPAIRQLSVLLSLRTRRTALHPFPRPTDVDLAHRTSTGRR